MAQTLRTVAEQVVAAIRLIRKQDAAGINPTNAEIRDLYDLAERLDVEVRLNEPALPCSVGGCTRAAEQRLSGQPYCGRCWRALTAVTTQVRSDAVEIARTRIEAMVAGRVPWPSGETQEPAGDPRGSDGRDTTANLKGATCRAQ